MEQLTNIPGDDIKDLLDVYWFRWHNPPGFFQNPPMVSDEVVPNEESDGNLLGVFSRWNPLSSNISMPRNTQKPVITFEPFFGDPQTGAIFRRTDRPEIKFRENVVSLEELSTAFDGERINPEAFVEHLAQIQLVSKYEPPTSEGEYDPEPVALSCLKGLETAVMVYKRLFGVTISLHVIAHDALASTY